MKRIKDQIDLSKMQSVSVMGPYGYERLNRYWKEPNNEMWDSIWSNTDELGFWESSLRGELSPIQRRVYLKYLPPKAKVLEAGCGVGQVVLALRARGFDCYGLDYAHKIIGILNKKFPKVPFNYGDIRELPYPNKSFEAYISLGVIEHFVNGQDKMLNEAARVVKSGGYIFLQVPYLNPFRKIQIKLGLYKKSNIKPDAPYFESCFSFEELENLLSDAGFTFQEKRYVNPIMSFAQESFFRPLYWFIEDISYVRGAVDKLLNLILPASWFGHMIMIIAKRK